ncbi:hypothetical protein FS837_007888, partial [Tulasnella sp. UAMH 9824]
MTDIHCIPSELLSYVVELACLADAPSQTRTAAVLGRVSKLWRETVVSTPAIWTDFHVSKGRDPKSFEAPLLRSGGLLVDVHVVDEATKLNAAREQLKVLAEHSSRWRNVEISHPDAFALLANTTPQVLPKLQSLVVKTTFRRVSPELMYFYEPLPEYPAAPDLPLDWKNRMYPSLRYLDLCDIEAKPQDTEDFLDFLEAHSSLERLVLKK